MTDLDPHRVDPDTIADYGIEDYQMLNWRDEDGLKIPKQPAAPEANAKSSDAATWGAFDTALENAAGRDDLGLGFPCAQPGHPFLFIDVDIPDGDDEWVPDFDRLGGCVIERSPSGVSRRVILRGCEVPAWWTNQADPGKDTREVKIFDETGYVTLTGDTIDGYGPPLEETHDHALERWLKDAWRAFNPDAGEGAEPWIDERDTRGLENFESDGTAGRVADGDEWMTEADVRDALEHVDPDVVYDEWRDVGFALVDFFDSRSTARSVFTDWSRGGQKWDDRASEAADRIINDADSTAGANGVTIGTVVELAKAGGWDMSACPSARDGAGGAGDDAGAGDDWDGDGSPAGSSGRGGSASGSTSTVVERDDGYYRRTVDEDGNARFTQITNFTIDVNNLLTHADGTHEYHLTVVPGDDVGDEPYDVAVEPAAFNEPRSFKSEVVTGFSVWSDAGYDDVNAIRALLSQQGAPRRAGTVTIGMHDDELVVPDGALTADGWSDEPGTVFTGNVECGWSIEPGDGYDRDAVAETLELLPQTRQRTLERFLPALGWFYAAPLSPTVREWEGEFNILNVLGDTGAGKTATLETFDRLFGFDGDLNSANDTPFPKMIRMASTSLPLIFDEYKPAEMGEYRTNQFHNHIRVSTRGGVAERGKPDMTVDRYHLRAPICVAGEQPIQGPAEERRSILTSFTKDDVQEAPASTDAFARLRGGVDNDGTTHDAVDLSQHAVAYYEWLLEQDRDDLRGIWSDARATVAAQLTEWGLSGLDDLVVQGYVTVLFGTRLYRAFADEMGVDATAVGVTDENALEAIYYLTREGHGAKHHSHVDRLFDVLDRALADGALEAGVHYATVDPRDGDPLVVFKMDRTFDKIRKYAREHDVAGVDLLDSYGDYRGRVRDAVDDDESPIIDTSRYVRDFGRGVAVERATFDTLTEHGDGGDGDADTDAETDAAPASARSFAALEGGYQTLVGTVTTVADPAPWLAGEGTIIDGNGHPLTYHVREGATPDNGAGESDLSLTPGATYRLENARVTTNGDGEQIVELLPGTTTAAVLREPTGGEQTGLADGGDGTLSQAERRQMICAEIDAASAHGDTVTHAELAGRLTIDPTVLSSDLESLAEKGRIVETDGAYES